LRREQQEEKKKEGMNQRTKKMTVNENYSLAQNSTAV